MIMTEYSQYNVLKDAVRAKPTRQSSRPDVEKIKKDIRSEVEEDYRKKKCHHRRFELAFENSRLYFHTTRRLIQCL